LAVLLLKFRHSPKQTPTTDVSNGADLACALAGDSALLEVRATPKICCRARGARGIFQTGYRTRTLRGTLGGAGKNRL